MHQRPQQAAVGVDRNIARYPLRGGAWGNTNEQNFRSANRNDNDPTNVNTNTGFRVVLRSSPLSGRSRKAHCSFRACR